MPIISTPRTALAGAVQDLVGAVESAGENADWEFAADGPAATDWASHDRPSGWGSQPLQDAYRTGALLWYVVADQALSVADLLTSGRSLGLLSASRALAESAARCGVLLRTESPPSDRVRRMINERLFALHEDWRFATQAPPLDSSWQLPAARRIVDVGAKEMGLSVQVPTGRRPGWVGEKRESTMDVLASLIDHRLLASMFYRNTSAVSHAALHGLVKRLELRETDEGTYRARLRSVTSAEAATEITAALVALAIAGRALMIQTGWPIAGYAAADARLQTIIQSLIT